MLEGVLKVGQCGLSSASATVSILGMLEGVLKEIINAFSSFQFLSFNPWYVGGGVKSICVPRRLYESLGVSILGMLEGVLKAQTPASPQNPLSPFQSLVCWRGC